MGRAYAGILGPLAFGTVVARGLVQGSSVESTLEMACICLFVFAVIGWLVGGVAGQIVDDSVRARFASEQKAQQAETAAETRSSG